MFNRWLRDVDAWLLRLGLPPGVDWAAVAIGLLIALVIVVTWVLLRRKRSAEPEVHRPLLDPKRLLLSENPPGPADEKREEPRQRHGNVRVEIADAEGNAKPFQGWVVDRSPEGLRLSVEAPFDVDAIIMVRPARTHELVSWLKVQVRHCRQTGDCWEVGCHFLQPPISGVLMLFG